MFIRDDIEEDKRSFSAFHAHMNEYFNFPWWKRIWKRKQYKMIVDGYMEGESDD